MKRNLMSILTVMLISSTVLGQSAVNCEEGIIEEHGEDMDAYYTQTNTCTYGNIVVKDETMEDAFGCKLTCHTISYYQIRSGKEVKVDIGELFTKNKAALLSKINTELKKDFSSLASNNPDCFDGISFREVGLGGLQLSISEYGFTFSAPTGVPGYCKGPAGETGTTFSIEEITPFL